MNYQKMVFLCVQSLVKYAKINPSRFSFLQLQALFWFIIARFSLKNIIVLGLHLTHFSSFIFNKAEKYLQYFLFPKRIIGFLELALSDFPIRSQSSISEDSTLAYILPNTDITVLQFIICSGIWYPLRTKLFHIPYCSRAFVEVSLLRFSRLLNLDLSLSLSSCSFLIMMSSKLVISSRRLLILLAMFSSNSMAFRCGSFSKKKRWKKLLSHRDKNYCYFCKSNLSVIILILGSKNMIKLWKIMCL